MKPHLQETFNIIGKHWNIFPLTPNENGVITLQFEQSGMLFIELQEEVIFMYLLDNFESVSTSLASKALVLCQPSLQTPPVFIHPIMVDRFKLGFLAKINSEDFTPSFVEQTLQVLMDHMSQLKTLAQKF